jgi:hypothetical protein
LAQTVEVNAADRHTQKGEKTQQKLELAQAPDLALNEAKQGLSVIIHYYLSSCIVECLKYSKLLK